MPRIVAGASECESRTVREAPFGNSTPPVAVETEFAVRPGVTPDFVQTLGHTDLAGSSTGSLEICVSLSWPTVMESIRSCPLPPQHRGDLYFHSSVACAAVRDLVSVDQNKALPEPPLRSKFGFKYCHLGKQRIRSRCWPSCVQSKDSRTGQLGSPTIRTASNFTTSSPGAVLKSAHSVEEC